MKILIVCDKLESAIGKLAKSVVELNPHFDIHLIAVHPKRPDPEQIEDYVKYASEADIVDYQYWKTAMMLRENLPDVFNKASKKILQHHNPYDVDKEKWDEIFDKVIVNNETIHRALPYAELIHNSVDVEYNKFNDDYTTENVVQMVAARIGKEKGVREVAQACKELGYKFLLVGRPSKQDYLDEVLKINPDTDYRRDISDEAVRQSYYESAIHVCNSYDNYESGTLPILEAMSCGVPVLTRKIGHVPDINNGENIVVRVGKEYDIENLKTELKNLMEDSAKRIKMREKAWQSVRNWSNVRRAWDYSKLYYQVYSDKPLVSVVVATCNRPENIKKLLDALEKQDYPNIEVVISEDSILSKIEMVIMQKGLTRWPVKHFLTNKVDNTYGLAKARNIGCIEAQGEIIVIFDDRFAPEPNAVSEFVKNLYDNMWLYGNKGIKKSFVENFSCIYQKDLISGGMFNEEINEYGGMTQEVRNRFEKQGFIFRFIESAKANELSSTHSRSIRKLEILHMKDKLYKMGL
jgi:glycosyltransferase involved in cell wall biosynthesis